VITAIRLLVLFASLVWRLYKPVFFLPPFFFFFFPPFRALNVPFFPGPSVSGVQDWLSHTRARLHLALLDLNGVGLPRPRGPFFCVSEIFCSLVFRFASRRNRSTSPSCPRVPSPLHAKNSDGERPPCTCDETDLDPYLVRWFECDSGLAFPSKAGPVFPWFHTLARVPTCNFPLPM